jgi:hypothetical protein
LNLQVARLALEVGIEQRDYAKRSYELALRSANGNGTQDARKEQSATKQPAPSQIPVGSQNLLASNNGIFQLTQPAVIQDAPKETPNPSIWSPGILNPALQQPANQPETIQPEPILEAKPSGAVGVVKEKLVTSDIVSVVVGHAENSK